MSLELAAMRWLWIEKKCMVVLEQRTPFAVHIVGQPDVLAVTPGRHLVEIEIKRSVADFKADFRKLHRVNRDHYLKFMPRQFYYMVDEKLHQDVKHLVPEWAGLLVMTDRYYVVRLEKSAPVNKLSEKLSVKNCAKLARQMTAHMMGYVIGRETRFEQFKNYGSFSHVDWIDAEKGTWEI